MIHKLVSFIANNDLTYSMGNHIKQPNFQNALDLLAYLIKSCMTCGISQVQHYSPTSIFQQEHQAISLP